MNEFAARLHAAAIKSVIAAGIPDPEAETLADRLVAASAGTLEKRVTTRVFQRRLCGMDCASTYGYLDTWSRVPVWLHRCLNPVCKMKHTALSEQAMTPPMLRKIASTPVRDFMNHCDFVDADWVRHEVAQWEIAKRLEAVK